MSRKNKNQKSFLEKITELESVFGQKETAKRLGVSPATLRNYKNGKSDPAKNKKLNRVYGQNKKHVTEEKLEKYVKKVEKKKEIAKKVHKRNKIVFESTSKWAHLAFENPFLREKIFSVAPDYIAYYPTDRHMGQFMNDRDRRQTGKPKGVRSLYIYGLYTNQYLIESYEDEAYQVIKSRFPVLGNQVKEEWDLERALAILESKIHSIGEKIIGKIKYMPTTFIGFSLE